MVWSGIQGFTALHYQARIKPGDRILICTGNAVSNHTTAAAVDRRGRKGRE